MGVVHGVAQGIGESDRDLPVLLAGLGGHDLAHWRDAPLGVGEGSVLFEERGAGQKHVRIFCGLVQKQVLHHDALHSGERGRDVLGVRVGLDNVLTLAVQTHEGVIEGRLEHVGDAQPRFRLQRHPPMVFKERTHRAVRDVPIAWQLVRERAHVARALHIVLAA